MFSLSCAGFALLTPYRPLFTGLAVISLTVNALYGKSKVKPYQTVFSILLSIALMISPEITQSVNRYHPESSLKNSQYYRVNLNGLGCEACANRIKNRLSQEKWILSARVFFDNHTAIIETLFDTIDRQKIIVDLIESIDSKYQGQVLDAWTLSN
jgi:copper chaperone CopZ